MAEPMRAAAAVKKAAFIFDVDYSLDNFQIAIQICFFAFSIFLVVRSAR
jgi:hypothetical protein